MCTHNGEASHVILCRHVAMSEAPAEVILASDDGTVDFCLCAQCFESGDDLQQREAAFLSYCRECAAALDVPHVLPHGGKWELASALLCRSDHHTAALFTAAQCWRLTGSIAQSIKIETPTKHAESCRATQEVMADDTITSDLGFFVAT
jgi:hypothetical protein